MESRTTAAVPMPMPACAPVPKPLEGVPDAADGLVAVAVAATVADDESGALVLDKAVAVAVAENFEVVNAVNDTLARASAGPASKTTSGFSQHE